MLHWMCFPKSDKPPDIVIHVVEAFKKIFNEINSYKHNLKSNEVLLKIAPNLETLGFNVERGKKSKDKILVPVLFGLNGKPEKSFEADAYNEQYKMVLEVEAGRGVLNNQFLKDLFQASVMHNVELLCIAVRNVYKGREDFNQVIAFFETLYASNRLDLPLRGIVIIGY